MPTSAGRLNNIQAKLENGAKRGLLLAGQVVAQRATRKAPRDTGRLKRSITFGRPKQVERNVWIIEVGTNVEYARAQEFGSGLHAERGPRKKIEIKAKNARVLAFNWPNGPAEVQAKQAKYPLVFYRSIQHPGVQAQPYLRPAITESKDVIKLLLIRNLIHALRQ